MYRCDIAIIGGGASALAAAVEAARLGASVFVFERLARVGKKILVTGNGRCNLSNRSIAGEDYFGSVDPMPIFERFGDCVSFFASLGLYTRADAEGRLYPISGSASSVLDALRLECEKLGVCEICNYRAESLEKTQDGFLISSSDNVKALAKRVILAFGGKAAPELGTDGSAFSLIKPFGLACAPLRPALAPIKCPSPLLRSVKGLRAAAAVTAFSGGKPVGESRGEIQLGDGAVSGICVFELAHLAPDELSIDFMAEFSQQQLFGILSQLRSVRGSVTLEDAFSGLLNKRLAQFFIKKRLSLPLGELASALSDDELRALADEIKSCRLEVCGSDYGKAQATLGGVAAGELSPSLELKKLPGAYLCGEAADVLGRCGGYNLHWAWSSGRCAGYSAALSLGGQNDA
jgi:hypothetical protein